MTPRRACRRTSCARHAALSAPQSRPRCSAPAGCCLASQTHTGAQPHLPAGALQAAALRLRRPAGGQRSEARACALPNGKRAALAMLPVASPQQGDLAWRRSFQHHCPLAGRALQNARLDIPECDCVGTTGCTAVHAVVMVFVGEIPNFGPRVPHTVLQSICDI